MPDDGEPGDLAKRLLSSLSPELRRLVEEVRRAAQRARAAAYLVGGAVRDFLLGRPVVDVDVVVVGDAAAIAREAARRAGGSWVVFDAFGTARVHAWGVRVDVARARTERYRRPGALPEPSPAGAVEEDLGRRDFTINAMAVPLVGDERALVDPWSGREDLRARRLRALHSQSFRDDPTRLFRAVRLSVRYGLRIEPTTRTWMRQAMAQRAVDTVSAERRGAEVRRALGEHPAEPMARAFQRWGLWDAACPGWRLHPRSFRALSGLDRLVQADPGWPGRLGLEDASEAALVMAAEAWVIERPAEAAWRLSALSRRLALTRRERQALTAMPRTRRALAVLGRTGGNRPRPSTADRLMAGLPPACLAYLAAAGGGPGTPAARWVEWYVRQGREIRPKLSGHDVLAMGCPPGPAVRAVLEGLRAAVLDGRIREQADEVAWVRRRLRRMARWRGGG